MQITQEIPRDQSLESGPSPTDVVVSSSGADAAAVEAVKNHHAQLAGVLRARSEALVMAVGAIVSTGIKDVERSRRDLVEFCMNELLPHAAAEEGVLYPAAAALPPGGLLVDAMVAEHRVLKELVGQVRDQSNPVRVAAAAYALNELFMSHLDKENELILPLLAAEPSVSLSGLLEGMHHLLGDGGGHEESNQASESQHAGAADCGCGGSQAAANAPDELDLRSIPHSIRHATAFGAIAAIPAGGAIVLIAPHDPIPLLRQIETREPGLLTTTYQERGPQAWRVRLDRSR
ncbi:MAG: DUF2249 domain-containing protein [Candidatus Nanopelagicales bacterium]